MNLGAKNEVLIYYPVDTDFIQPHFARSHPTKLTIGHFPSNPFAKGTKQIIEVIQMLQRDVTVKDRFEYIGTHSLDMSDRGCKVDYIDWLDNLELMRRCDVIIETMNLEIDGKPFGEWGNTALEAAALGKIVVTNTLSQELYRKEYGDLGLWIANNKLDLESQLRTIIGLDDAHPFSSMLVQDKMNMRAWVEKYHSIPATGKRLWEKVFKDVFGE
jgi:glycosyltransferase involved in cell wall biosynthesis